MEEKYLVDANIFIALNWKQDPQHQKAGQLLSNYFTGNSIFFINNYIVSEILTVLLLRLKNPTKTANLGLALYGSFPNLKVTQITKSLQLKSLKIFSRQHKHHLSFPDCTLLAQAQHLKIKNILTFDKNLQKVAKKLKINSLS
ncbi:MAG: type II toxin-antitoxin system VapC family toxin [Candidatus Beckwithbacteria bacterium]